MADSLGDYIGQQARDSEDVKTQFGASEIASYLQLPRPERVAINQSTVVIKERDTSADFKWNQCLWAGGTFGSATDSTNVAGTFQVDNAITTGMKINILSSCDILQIEKFTACTATKVNVQDSLHNNLLTASFVGNTATLSQSITAGQNYYVVVHNDGSVYNRTYDAVAMPRTGSFLNFTHRTNNTGGGNWVDNADGVQAIDYMILSQSRQAPDGYWDGEYAEDMIVQRVINPNNRFSEAFRHLNFINTASSTATISTSTHTAHFVSGNDLISEVVFTNVQQIIKSTFTIRPTTSTFNFGSDALLYLSANSGSDWEEVTNGSSHVFRNPGTHLLYKISALTSGTICPDVPDGRTFPIRINYEVV